MSGISHEVIDILEILQHLWRLLATFSPRLRISVDLGSSGKKILALAFHSLTLISL